LTSVKVIINTAVVVNIILLRHKHTCNHFRAVRKKNNHETPVLQHRYLELSDNYLMNSYQGY